MSEVNNSIRSLALAKSSSFRTTIISVAEWDNAQVTVREPSAESWVKFREIMSPDLPEGEEPPKLSHTQEYQRNKRADVLMFMDVLLDENGNRVFSDEDESIVSDSYGPVHSRLLSKALKLTMSQENAEAK
ncbi:phage tail assembly chaperone [Candidatus Pantoea multigeneris]|uniref:Phage tail protein n=1 Tax=Candidatus Pantoea multigeneris TaxID=2608357 RepID=A0ABX0R806_9GAMM|nr:phage tail assembly chaperone [Pantoea multigeneris]NIF20578.1 phage tail protein [Pantoea multigeneris]